MSGFLPCWRTWRVQPFCRRPIRRMRQPARRCRATSANPQPPAPTTAPVIVSADPGDAQVAFAWTAVPNASGYQHLPKHDGRVGDHAVRPGHRNAIQQRRADQRRDLLVSRRRLQHQRRRTIFHRRRRHPVRCVSGSPRPRRTGADGEPMRVPETAPPSRCGCGRASRRRRDAILRHRAAAFMAGPQTTPKTTPQQAAPASGTVSVMTRCRRSGRAEAGRAATHFDGGANESGAGSRPR